MLLKGLFTHNIFTDLKIKERDTTGHIEFNKDKEVVKEWF